MAEKANKDEVQSLVTNKAEITYVDSKVASVASGSPKGVYATLSALQTAFPTGTTGIYLVTADGKWYYWSGSAWVAGGIYQATSVADKSINFNKTNFLTTGKNIFNKDTSTSGGYVRSIDGAIASEPGFYYSEYIPVLANTSYVKKGTYQYACYDSNKNFLSGGNGTAITTPVNAAYIRISAYATDQGSVPGIDKEQLEIGTISTAYESYYYKLQKLYLESAVFQKQLDAADMSKVTSGMIVKPEQIIGFTSGSRNLFNKDKATIGGYINSTNGNISADANFYYSEYIPVTPGTNYVKKSTYSFAFYDINKVFISGGGQTTQLGTAPANAAYVRISTYYIAQGSVPGIDGEQLEVGTISTAYETWKFTIDDFAIPSEEKPIYINLPPKIYGLVGQELNIYFDNIISDKDTKFEFDVICSIGGHYDNYFRVTPTTSGTFPITVVAYKNNKEVARASANIIVKSISVGNGVNKKVLIIGDSTIDNTFLVPHLYNNFSSDVMKITPLGIRGTAPYKHEGRAGWGVDLYFGDNPSYTSPFMLNGVFDFSQYITTNGLQTPDYVFINLGINDVFGVTEGATLDSKISTIMSRYQTMINSIKTQNPNVKVCICCTIPPNYSQDSFGVCYGSGTTRKDYKRTNFIFVQNLIQTFQNREAENIYLVPIHLNLDTRYNFGLTTAQVNNRNTKTIDFPGNNGEEQNPGVHPAESGYWQIADSYWYFLKSFEV
jgi:lysophospholipase L1-like esterase